MKDTAVLLLLVLRHYGYNVAPSAVQAAMFSALGALVIAALVLYTRLPNGLKAWALAEELQTAGCTTAWILWPWPLGSGELCSDALGFKLGSIGLLWLALAMWAHNRTGVQVTRGDK